LHRISKLFYKSINIRIEWEQMDKNTALAIAGLQSDQRIKFWHRRKKSVFWEGGAISQRADDDAHI